VAGAGTTDLSADDIATENAREIAKRAHRRPRSGPIATQRRRCWRISAFNNQRMGTGVSRLRITGQAN
jgi:hypothetical protein